MLTGMLCAATVNAENRLASMDAAAIQAAAALLQSNHARAERKMFVITDGCGKYDAACCVLGLLYQQTCQPAQTVCLEANHHTPPHSLTCMEEVSQKAVDGMVAATQQSNLQPIMFDRCAPQIVWYSASL